MNVQSAVLRDSSMTVTDITKAAAHDMRINELRRIFYKTNIRPCPHSSDIVIADGPTNADMSRMCFRLYSAQCFYSINVCRDLGNIRNGYRAVTIRISIFLLIFRQRLLALDVCRYL